MEAEGGERRDGRGKGEEREEGRKREREKGVKREREGCPHTYNIPSRKKGRHRSASVCVVRTETMRLLQQHARVVTYKYRDSEDDDDEDMAPKKHCTYRISSSGILLVCRNVSILSRLRFVQYFYTYIAKNCLVIV